MARETKIGMVVGIGFIVCFAIVLSHRGQLTDVKDSPGFEIESILGEAPAQSDSEQVRRTARKIGQSRPASSRRSATDHRTVADRDANSRQAESGRQNLSRASENAETPQNRLADETPRRFAEVSTRRMGDTPSGPQRFLARRDPIEADTVEKPASEPIDLTTGDSPLEPVDPANRSGLSGDRLARPAPAANIRSQRPEPTSARSVRSTHNRQEAIPTMTTDELRDHVAHQSSQPQDNRPLVSQPRIIGEHVIESGDTLVRIARRYYASDDPSIITAIFEANRDQLKSPDRIVTNRRLQLPYIEVHSNSAVTTRSETTLRAPDIAPAPGEPNDESRPSAAPARDHRQPPLHRDPKRYYEIKSGDTLSEIAKKQYGTAHPHVLRQIQQANPKAIPDLNTVVKGRRIELPLIAGLANPIVEAKPTEARLASATTIQHLSPARGAETDETENSQRDWRWYELKKGDVYSKVASRLLGSSRRWTELAEMNKDIFPDPSRIRHGVRIRVPIESEMIATTGAHEG